MSASRAGYFKQRRKKFKALSAEVEIDVLERFEKLLSEKNITKKDWMNSKVAEELSRVKE